MFSRHGVALRVLHGSVVLLVVSLTCVVVFPQSQPVEAAGSCDEVMPWSVATDFVFKTRTTGEFEAVSNKTAPLVVGGVSAATGSVASGTAATVLGGAVASAAAFLAASKGTCTVIDFFAGDNMAYKEMTLPTSSVIRSAGFDPYTLTFPTAIPTAVGGNWTWMLNGVSRSYGGSFVQPAIDTNFGTQSPFFDALPEFKTGYNASTQVVSSHRGTSWSFTNNVNSSSYFNGRTELLSKITTSVGSPCDTTTPVGGIGLVCGVPPGTVMSFADGVTSLGQVSMPRLPLYILPVSPEANFVGWRRYLIADVYCVNVGGSGASWSRWTGSTYVDGTITERFNIPSCPTGKYPHRFVLSRVPVNINTTAGSVPERYVIEDSSAPAVWATGVQPSYVVCLTAATDCGTPTMTLGVCQWGAYDVPSSFCTDIADGQVTGPASKVGTVGNPRPTTDLAVSTPVVTEKSPDATPAPSAPGIITEPDTPPDGGSGTDIEVPIDGGSGNCGGVVGCVQGTEIGGGSNAECWPDGWGWFNPAQWVLRPIKCAMVWAFVPSDAALEDFITDAEQLARGNFPFSLLFVLIDFFQDTADAVSTTTGCIDTGMTIEGTVVPCVDVPNAPFAGARSTVATIVVGLLIASIAASCVSLVTEK